MVCCAYCGEPATQRIISNPEHVCLDHALEFWIGLMGYVRDHAQPCVKDAKVCGCQACAELHAAQRRAEAIAAAGPSPDARPLFPIRLAS